ncbi:hypothetical protein EXW59_10255 [Bacillus mycoides]|nr:hypothetical protein EXW59_10255 [Bacillus mycoides]QWI42081.1 hypothetical protein EXW55_03515 [Bacillus mycoides]
MITGFELRLFTSNNENYVNALSIWAAYFIFCLARGFFHEEKTPYKVSSFDLKHFKFNNIRSRHLPIRLKFYSISEQNFVLILNP